MLKFGHVQYLVWAVCASAGVAAGQIASIAEPAAAVGQPSNSPLVALEALEHGVELAIDADRVAALRSIDTVVLRGVPVDQDTTLDLDVVRFDVFTPDATIEVWNGDERRTIEPSGVVLLRGTVAGDDDSTAFIALTETSVNGFVESEGHTYIISNGRHGTDDPIVAYNLTTLPEGAMTIAEFICQTGAEHKINLKPNISGGETSTRSECGTIELALDTDYEFSSMLFANDEAAATAYIETLVGATNTIYKRDVDILFSISYLRLWSDNSDPYYGYVDHYLNEMQYRWYYTSPLKEVHRDLAHVLSPTDGGGGLAYRGVICDPYWGYAASTGIGGYFPQPLGQSSQNWDIIVFPHELGHNCGTGHTHDNAAYSPLIDGCGNGNCTGASDGTMMSYCHHCPGGIANVNLEFHPRVQTVIEDTIAAAPCVNIVSSPAITLQPVSQEACLGQPVTLSIEVDSAVTPTYQWYHNSLGVPGANSSTYAIANLSASDLGIYYVRASTACATVTSGAALLTQCEGQIECDADLTTQGASEGSESFGVPDGIVTGADIAYYINAWLDFDTDIADLTTQGSPIDAPGYGVPDGEITGTDLGFYVNLWLEDCS